MSDPVDAITEMLVRTVPGAPVHLLADAAKLLCRIIDNVRRAERQRAVQDLVRFGMNAAADKLRETET